MSISRVPILFVYSGWLEKAKHELSLFKESYNVYDLTNCFLTLNALPEWIQKSNQAPEALKELATNKIDIMKTGSEMDENKLDDLDHQLRLIRLFSNQSKHGETKEKLGLITLVSKGPLKFEFPVKCDHLCIGTEVVDIFNVLENVIEFWSREIKNA